MNCSYEQSEPQKPPHITFPIRRAIKESERVGEERRGKEKKEQARKKEEREKKKKNGWVGSGNSFSCEQLHQGQENIKEKKKPQRPKKSEKGWPIIKETQRGSLSSVTWCVRVSHLRLQIADGHNRVTVTSSPSEAVLSGCSKHRM